MTLAHELGHGMHFPLSRRAQTPLSAHTGLALAEVPLDLRRVPRLRPPAGGEPDPATRRALTSERVEGSFATIFRQTVLARYEQGAYALRAEGRSAHRRAAG